MSGRWRLTWRTEYVFWSQAPVAEVVRLPTHFRRKSHEFRYGKGLAYAGTLLPPGPPAAGWFCRHWAQKRT